MDVSDTLSPKGPQLDAVELTAPRTFTIESVTKNESDQPLHIHLVDFPRTWRPGVTMRRVLAGVWGSDARKWAGLHVTLFNDPDVSYGKDKTGGTRIASMSGIDKPKAIAVLLGQGRAGTYTVQPMSDVDALRAEWGTASADRRTAIEAEVAALTSKETTA